METNKIDISKINEAIKMIRDTCLKHQYCSGHSTCPFYNKEYADCSFKVSSNPEGWDLLDEGDV